MLQSFFVYITFGVSLILLGNISWLKVKFNKVKPITFWSWDIIAALLAFGILAGLRWNVGTDHLTYLDNYLSIQNNGYPIYDMEIGFDLFTQILANNGIHFTIYFGALAVLQIFFIYKAFEKERYLYQFLGIVIIFAPHFLGWMDGIRQMLVATIFVWSIKYIFQKKLIKYILIILVSALIHRSAFLLLIFYFFPKKDIFKKRINVYILVAISLILGSNTFWIENIERVGELLKLIGYSGYSENILGLIEDMSLRNIGPRRLTMILVPLIIIWYSPKLKDYFNNTMFILYYNLTIFGFISYNLLSNTHHVFVRPTLYFTIFTLVTASYLLVYLKNKRSTHLAMYLITIIIVISYLPISIIAENGKGLKDYVNYNFYWEYPKTE